jgi:hypothetical protein
MIYTILKLDNGWYDFKLLPQEHRYIKIHGLNCGTDRKAKNNAKKIIGAGHTFIFKSEAN